MRWGIFSPRSSFFKRKMYYTFSNKNLLYASKDQGTVLLPCGTHKVHTLHDILNKVDAIYICTPPSSHYTYAKQILDKKKHVLCEKPLSLCENEIDDLIFRAKRNNVRIGMTFQPFFKDWDNITKIINESTIKPQSFKSLFTLTHTGPIEDVIFEVGFYPTMAAMSFSNSEISTYSFFQKNSIYYANIIFTNKINWLVGCSINCYFQQYIKFYINQKEIVFNKPYTDNVKSKIYCNLLNDFETKNYGFNSILLLKKCCNFLNAWSKHVSTL